MLEIIIYGGLGNQMFEYACAKAYSLDCGEDLILNIGFFKIDRFKRSFSLSNYNLAKDVTINKKRKSFLRFLSYICRINRKLFFKVFSFFGYYIWQDVKFKKIRFATNKKILYGYFQSEQYFKKYSSIIKHDFVCTAPLSREVQKILNEIRELESVCVHVRRGDYVTEGLLVCDLNYYLSAVDHIKKQLAHPLFFVFSDDVEWVQKNIVIDNAIYVPGGHKDYEELELMRNCKHFIISNSSFSWWAQYLSDNDKKIVIAPKQWAKGEKANDIYMPDWFLL